MTKKLGPSKVAADELEAICTVEAQHFTVGTIYTLKAGSMDRLSITKLRPCLEPHLGSQA